ncbi:MAG: phosphoribosylglycinamide formyltransferase [Pseudomonadales bacterium]|jgi:phosphoribosylglycinamide formyltransferase-1|nr:phosphoribosylglycinamide formyltransferase [Pseudomonadales bacterium]
MIRLAVLASHEGTTLQAVIDAVAAGEVDAQIVLVCSNNSGSGALKRARAANIPTCHISSKSHGSQAQADQALLDELDSRKVDWLLLLGYMKKLGELTLEKYSGRIINTHPARLPKFGGKGFYGRAVHEAVIAAEEKESGATIHLVEKDYDSGPILAQSRVTVDKTDDAERLEAKVKLSEQRLLVATLRQLADGDLPAQQ